ncbi:MAG: hypothetical protein H6696_08430 [Deferribacteres bacterium]|nr:hypothetical protein [candidate division KSB1 bacterium]MCB9501949.1 hypothetical protein [Deferribacteres bacterium]
MQWTKKTIVALSLCLSFFGSIVAQQQISVTEINYEKFIRFTRLDISLTDRAEYSFVDDLEHGALVLNLQAALPQTLNLPEMESGELSVSGNGNSGTIQINFPSKFRYESFFYPPEKKIIIDIYESKEPADRLTVPKKIPVNTGSAYLAGITALQTGDTTEAVAQFRKVIEENPNHTRAHLQLGMLLSLQKDKKQALYHLKRAQENVEFAFISNLYIANLNEKGKAADTSVQRPSSTRVVQTQSPEKSPTLDEPTQVDSAPSPMPLRSQLANAFVIKSVLIAAGSLVVLILLYSVWRNYRRRSSGKDNREDQVQRIIKLMEKNNLYRNTKSPEAHETRSRISQQTQSLKQPVERIDLRDDTDVAMPVSEELKTRIQLAEGYPPSEQRIESSRLRQIQRTMNENNIVPQGRNRLTPTALKAKSEILDYALDGYSVREIAEKLQIGVGEVELVLGLRKSGPATPAPVPVQNGESNLRIDFADN